ncbi:MAG: YqeG family HAD IIIA-type phosphatase [Clostridia bacterium]|nr:YqeG family HAD IIIA-type phosphatase [Clostridia bacterium]
MILYPNMLLNSVTEITPEILEKNNIKALILDVDNTLINYQQELKQEVKKWVEQMKQNKTKLYILSNTNDKEKVGKVSKALDIPYINLAKKPFKKGFLKVQNILKEKPENIAAVGDQIFTDVIGGNRCNMFTILVEPIQKKEYWYTRWKRPIEDLIKNKYKKQSKKEKI